MSGNGHVAGGAPLPAADALPDRLVMEAFLENVPDFVHFKDREGRFLAVSRSKLRRNGLADHQAILGKTDFDFFSEPAAKLAKADEEEVMRTGVAVLRKLERVAWADGRTTWSIINKIPLKDERGEIIGTFGLTTDVTESKQQELALEKAHRELVEASRLAGMAEVATGVLHNVGNVLNSLNISAGVVVSGLQESKLSNLRKLCDLLNEHAGDPRFLADDPKGRRVPEFLESLSQHLLAERERLLGEIAALQKNIEHIKEIVAMQQSYATMVGVIEPLDAVDLMEAALRMNANALARHAVAVQRDYSPTAPVIAERAKVLQILVNLISNAKYAAEEGGREDRCVTLRIQPGEPGRVRLVVADNGIGIPADSLAKIFNHGFTTRREGHGFGLHSSLNAVREMKGTLTVESEGSGKGATFTLDLAAAPDAK
jgi:PAS domain S-box-containing protein